jgi:hypothetical protein
LFQNAACDRCLETTCCEPVATCADDRRCEAALACIANSCSSEVAAVLAGESASGVGALEREACEGASDPDAGGTTPCIARCLDLFTPRASAVATEDRAARCNATRTLTCGSRSGCGAQCSAFFTPPGTSSPDGG